MHTRDSSLVLSTLCAIAALAPVSPAHSPHDVIDAFAISPNYAVDRTIFCASGGSVNVFLVSRDGGGTWTEARSGLRGSIVRDIEMVADWPTSGEMYVLTSDAGLQVSNNGGLSWSRTNIRHTEMFHLSTALNAQSGALTLFYSGRFNLWRSDDRGMTETPLNVPRGGARIESITVSPTYWLDSTIVVTTDDGRMHVSQDQGTTWTSTQLVATGKSVKLSSNFANDGRMWVATWGAGVLSSSDAGATFSSTGSGFTDLFLNDISVVDAAQPGGTPAIMYASSKDDGVFESTDGGMTWSLTALDVIKTYQTTNHYTHITASPTWSIDSTVVCGAFEGLYMSSDNAATWSEANLNPTRAGRLVAVSPTYALDQTVFGAGYGMPVLKSSNGGDIWTYGWRGFHTNSFYSLAPSPQFATDQMVLVGGGSVPLSVGNGAALFRSIDGGETWGSSSLPRHPMQCDPFGNGAGYEIKSIQYSPDFARDRTVYAMSAMGVIYRSQDAAATWATWRGPVSTTRCWANTLALSPDFPNDGVMFVSGSGLHMSTDFGQTFTEIASVGHRTIVVPPDFPARGEAFGIDWYGELVRITQFGAQVTSSGAGFDGFSLTTLQVSPNFAVDNTVLAGTSGGGLFESTDRGLTWQAVSSPGVVDNMIGLSLSADFANDRTMFAGSYAGHARSTDGGRTWELTTDFESYDDTRDPWRDAPLWTQVRREDAVACTIHESSQVGAKIWLPFVGREVRSFAAFGPDRGIVEVRLDGALVATVDTYRSVQSSHELLYESRVPFGRHVIEMTVTGMRNPLSTGIAIGVDNAEVYYGTAGVFGNVGGGCVSSTGAIPATDLVGGRPRVGQTVQFQVSNAPANEPIAFMMIGLASLDIDLGPIGLAGCRQRVQFLEGLSTPTNASGVGTASLAISNVPDLIGVTFYTQPIIVDRGLNALGLVLGDAAMAILGQP